MATINILPTNPQSSLSLKKKVIIQLQNPQNLSWAQAYGRDHYT